MVFEVRRLEPVDAAIYRTIRLEALDRDPDAFGSTHAEEVGMSTAAMAARLETSATFCVFANGEVIGTAALLRKTMRKVCHRGEIVAMYIRSAWRGRGAANALMQALLAHADDVVTQVELNVVAENAPACRFYQRHGFIVCGRLPAAARCGDRYVDELIMVRQRPGEER